MVKTYNRFQANTKEWEIVKSFKKSRVARTIRIILGYFSNLLFLSAILSAFSLSGLETWSRKVQGKFGNFSELPGEPTCRRKGKSQSRQMADAMVRHEQHLLLMHEYRLYAKTPCWRYEVELTGWSESERPHTSWESRYLQAEFVCTEKGVLRQFLQHRKQAPRSRASYAGQNQPLGTNHWF